ncbi:hypothetical protein H0W26_04990 [Candidatus Dependentiae bacterium]|nr:hypothetical protein [Candidatus Dependentiae bacterium]
MPNRFSFFEELPRDITRYILLLYLEATLQSDLVLFNRIAVESAVSEVALSPNGETILIQSNDRMIQLWDTATGDLLKEFHEDEKESRWLALSLDEDTFLRPFTTDRNSVIGSTETENLLPKRTTRKATRLSRINPRDLLKKIMRGTHTHKETSLTVNPHKETHLTEASARDLLKNILMGGASSSSSVAYSLDGTTVLTIGHNTACLLDATTGKELQEFKGHTGFVYSVAFSPDGNSILTGSKDCTARLWDILTGKELLLIQHTSPLNSVAFSSSGTTMALGSSDGMVIIWRCCHFPHDWSKTRKECARELLYEMKLHFLLIKRSGTAY